MRTLRLSQFKRRNVVINLTGQGHGPPPRTSSHHPLNLPSKGRKSAILPYERTQLVIMDLITFIARTYVCPQLEITSFRAWRLIPICMQKFKMSALFLVSFFFVYFLAFFSLGFFSFFLLRKSTPEMFSQTVTV